MAELSLTRGAHGDRRAGRAGSRPWPPRQGDAGAAPTADALTRCFAGAPVQNPLRPAWGCAHRALGLRASLMTKAGSGRLAFLPPESELWLCAGLGGSCECARVRVSACVSCQ